MRILKILAIILLGVQNSALFAQDSDNKLSERDGELALEEVLVENWNAILDSIRTSRMKVKLFRKLLTEEDEQEAFDVKKYIELVERCDTSEKLYELLPEFENVMLGGKDLGVNAPFWGYQVEIWHQDHSTRTTWRDQKGSPVEDIEFTPHGVATWQPARPIVLQLDRSIERFTLLDTLYIPRFRSTQGVLATQSVDYSNWVSNAQIDLPEPRPNTIVVSTEDGVFRMFVDPETGMVTNAISNRQNSGIMHNSAGKIRIPSVDLVSPRVISKIHFSQSKPVLISLMLIESIEVNCEIMPWEITLGASKGKIIADRRAGEKELILFVTDMDVQSVFDFVRNRKPASRGFGTKDSGDEEKQAPRRDGEDELGNQLEAKGWPQKIVELERPANVLFQKGEVFYVILAFVFVATVVEFSLLISRRLS